MKQDEYGIAWSGEMFSWFSRGTYKKQASLAGEKGVLELIAVNAPLSIVLNDLCTAIDIQIGNVVSVISLPDGNDDHNPLTVALRARRFGLDVFWSSNIPLRDEKPLGFFDMYCCIPLAPSSFELQLIRKAAELAELAILSRQQGRGTAIEMCAEWKKKMFGRSYEAARLN
jgi:hypothetical protein